MKKKIVFLVLITTILVSGTTVYAASTDPLGWINDIIDAVVGTLATAVIEPIAKFLIGSFVPILADLLQAVQVPVSLLINTIIGITIIGILNFVSISIFSSVAIFVNAYIPALASMDILSTVGTLDDLISKVRVIGLSLFILILLFQVLKSMFAKIFGFEADETWQLLLKGILFGFLTFYSVEICRYITKTIFVGFMKFLTLNTAALGHLAAELTQIAIQDFLTNCLAILTPIIFFVVGFKLFMLIFKFIERLAITMILTIASPLAFACGVSKSTKSYFQGWIRSFAGNFVVQLFQFIGFVVIIKCIDSDLRLAFEHIGNTVDVPGVGNLSDAIYACFIYFLTKVVGKMEEMVKEAGLGIGASTGPLAGPLEVMSQIAGTINQISSAATTVFSGGATGGLSAALQSKPSGPSGK